VTLERFAEHWFLRVADTRLRQSTARDYRWRFNKYIKGRKEAKLPLWEYRTRDVQKIMDGVGSDHPKLAKASLQRTKALLSGIFRHSIRAGFREGNPVRDVFLPRRMTSGTDVSKRPPGVYEFNTVRLVPK
jgi:site-specific recombinase XerD